jgi:hypothetical protein
MGGFGRLFFGRHSGEHLLAVIPAKAGIHFDLSLALARSPCVRPCWFPSALLAAGSLSLLPQRK